MVAIPSVAAASQNPVRNGWSIPTPAPCPTTRTGPSASIHAAVTSPRGVETVNRSSRCIASEPRGPLPRASWHHRRMSGRLYLGTSGFAYDEWRKGVFYPEDLKKDDMLAYYSSQLSSVEINYTFRRFPSEKTLTTWRERATDGFVFTLKANQRITHWKKLKDVGHDVRDFLARASLLEDRLGCVLFQCPPTLVYYADLLEGFLATLPSFGGSAFAMEF